MSEFKSMLIVGTKVYSEIDSLNARLEIAVKALEEINRHELNAQRPGGGYSTAAMISYEALEKIRGMG